MSDDHKEIQDLRVDLAGVKKELTFAESLLLRVEQQTEQLIEISAELKSRQDIQEERVANAMTEIKSSQGKQEEHRKESNEQYEKLHARITDTERQLDERLDRIEKHLHKIEMWRWMIAGSIAVLGWLAGKLDFSRLF